MKHQRYLLLFLIGVAACGCARRWLDPTPAEQPDRTRFAVLAAGSNGDLCRSLWGGVEQAEPGFVLTSGGASPRRRQAPANPVTSAVTHGCVRIVTLDPNAPITAGTPQHKWLLHALAETPTAWKIVRFAEPPLGPCPHRGLNARWADVLLPLLESLNVDLVLSENADCYARVRRFSLGEGGHGVQYVVTGTGTGAPRRTAPAAWIDCYHAGPYVMLFEATPKHLDGRVLASDGRVFDHVAIRRPGDRTRDSLTDLIRRNREAHMPLPMVPASAIDFSRIPDLTPDTTLLSVACSNPANATLTLDVQCTIEGTAWQAAPEHVLVPIPPRQRVVAAIRVTPPPPQHFYPAPGLRTTLAYDDVPLHSLAATPVALNLPEADVPRTAAAPVVDGNPDDDCWGKATPIRATWRLDATGPAANATVFRVAATSLGFALWIDCREDDMAGVREAVSADRAPDIWQDDCVEILIDANCDRRTGQQFILTVGGFGGESRFTYANGKTQWTATTADWAHAVRKDNTGWTAEVLIPWTVLDFPAVPPSGTRMGFNLTRLERNRTGQASGDLPYAYTQWAVTHQGNGALERFGTLTIR